MNVRLVAQLTRGFVVSSFLVVAVGNAQTPTLIPNPTPALGDLFGFSVAAVGADTVIIGAPGDDSAAMDAGAAYLSVYV